MQKIIVTGSNGRFGKILQNLNGQSQMQSLNCSTNANSSHLLNIQEVNK